MKIILLGVTAALAFGQVSAQPQPSNAAVHANKGVVTVNGRAVPNSTSVPGTKGDVVVVNGDDGEAVISYEDGCDIKVASQAVEPTRRYTIQDRGPAGCVLPITAGSRNAAAGIAIGVGAAAIALGMGDHEDKPSSP